MNPGPRAQVLGSMCSVLSIGGCHSTGPMPLALSILGSRGRKCLSPPPHPWEFGAGVQSVLVARSKPDFLPLGRGCLVSRRPRAHPPGWVAASGRCHRGQTAPRSLWTWGVGSPLWASHIAGAQRHSASCLGDTTAGNCITGSAGSPPPRWLMGGAVHWRGLAFGCSVGS